MSVYVQLPNILMKLTDGKRTIEAEGDTVGDVVSELSQRYPGLEPRLRDENGQPYEFVTIYVNDEDIRMSGGFDMAVSDGDELTVVPAVAGG